MSLRTEGLHLLADSPLRWPGPAVHTRDDDFPNLCAGKTDRSTAPRCSRYTFQWPFDRNSNNSTGRTMNIPISINLVSRGRDSLGQHQESRPLGQIKSHSDYSLNACSETIYFELARMHTITPQSGFSNFGLTLPRWKQLVYQTFKSHELDCPARFTKLTFFMRLSCY